MSDGNGQTEKTPETKSAKSGGLDFGAVIAKLKDLGSFLSLDGKASRGEYWATFLLLSLPLVLLAVILTVVTVCFDLHAGVFSVLISTCLVIGNLVIFPVMVRRLRDAKVNVWLSVACLAVAAVPILGYLKRIQVRNVT